MERKKLEKIMAELDDIFEKYGGEHANLAIYLYMRYGRYEFNNYINDDEIAEIKGIFDTYDSIFNEQLNCETQNILYKIIEEEW